MRYLTLLLAGMVHGADLPAVLRDAGFQHFYNLEFDEAIAEFRGRAAAQPDSPQAHNLVAQAVIFRTMHRAGAFDSSLVDDTNPFFRRPKVPMEAEDEKLFFSSLDRAMKLAQGRLAREPDDPAALYALGVAHGLRANHNFVVKHAWIATLREFTQSRKFHARVSMAQPWNADARLTQGLHTYIAGNLVFPWKQLGLMAGFRGDKATGIAILREVAEQGEYNRADAAVFLSAIYRRDHRSAEGIPHMRQLVEWFPRNYVFRFELAALYLDLKQKENAEAVLDEVDRLHEARAPGFTQVPAARAEKLRSAVARL